MVIDFYFFIFFFEQSEAIPETLKNMLLVMLNGKVNNKDELPGKQDFWSATWTKVNTFLPHMSNELLQYQNSRQVVEKIPGKIMFNLVFRHKNLCTDFVCVFVLFLFIRYYIG